MYCTCGGTTLLDYMCKFCLKEYRERLVERQDMLQEEIYDIESDLDRIQFYLNGSA